LKPINKAGYVWTQKNDSERRRSVILIVYIFYFKDILLVETFTSLQFTFINGTKKANYFETHTMA